MENGKNNFRQFVREMKSKQAKRKYAEEKARFILISALGMVRNNKQNGAYYVVAHLMNELLLNKNELLATCKSSTAEYTNEGFKFLHETFDEASMIINYKGDGYFKTEYNIFTPITKDGSSVIFGEIRVWR